MPPRHRHMLRRYFKTIPLPLVGEELRGEKKSFHLGYLQMNNREMFEPSLPEEWHRAFKAIGFGTITKILLVFQKPFWDDQCRGDHTITPLSF